MHNFISAVLYLGLLSFSYFNLVTTGEYCTVLCPTLVFPTLVRFPLASTVLYLGLL